MISAIFNALVYTPLYNGLVFFVDVVPLHDVGIAVVILTLVVRVILFPLSRQAVRTQAAMREVAPEIDEIKKKFKDKQEEQARAIFALYREKSIRPFASFFLVLLQLPILFGLYWVFWKGGLPNVHPEYLYSFVPTPESVNMEFLGLINMGSHSILLAFFAGITQLIYARLSMGPRKPATQSDGSFSADMARSFDLQARYVLPIMIGGIAYTVSAAVPLYWVASNTFMILQELAMGRRLKEKKATEQVRQPTAPGV
ncbi:MAG: preprotein translocase subunit YidC [Parcubacteria group bacterium Gr01-1014_8]|nr:MAG: preprotein translocase subunit YidC [Parcubacteria group bacterium Gr01-1014_8]